MLGAKVVSSLTGGHGDCRRTWSRYSSLVSKTLPKLLAIGCLCLLSLSGLIISSASATTDCRVAHWDTLANGFRYEFPPDIQQKGLFFGRTKAPIQRKDVRDRILKEINYLLLDRRSKVVSWLSRADALRPIIAPILKQYQLPPEFIYLAAIESSYNSRALSSAGAYGYWQFIKSTAAKGPIGNDMYDWKMEMNKWKDERADLVLSTHCAARYLAWMNRVRPMRLDGQEREGFKNWLLTAAAYNAGPARVTERLTSFGASSYWDVPLPVETERYVPRWIALGIISQHRAFYGVEVPKGGRMEFDTVKDVQLNKDLTFSAMAKLLEATPRDVWSLNTQIPPEQSVFPAKSRGKAINHTINVPKGSANKFIAQLRAHGYVKK